MFRFLFVSFLLSTLVNIGQAQTCIIALSGHIEEAETGEKLSAATVQIKEIRKIIVTDKKGDFQIKNLCAGEYTLLIQHEGCESIERKISLTKDYHFDIFLSGSHQQLEEVTVSTQRGIRNSGFKKELSGKAMEESKGLSLAEALSKINGVTMLQTGSTISKPVIHGLHSNRILTINNGVRQEGQQWGNEHAPEIDPFIAEKLIVIKGVDELKYGSDAIGGVILVEPKALNTIPGKNFEFNSAYFSNNGQYVVSAVYEQPLKKIPALRFRVQGTYKRGGNATTPNYRLNNTGSEEKNASFTLGWKKNNLSSELFYSHFSTQVGIFTGSHIGNLTDLLNAIASDKPADVFLGEKTYQIKRPYQQVTHHLIKLKTSLVKNEHRFNLQVAGQFNERDEYDVVRSAAITKPQMSLSIYTLSEELTWEHPKKNNFSGIGGIAFQQQNNSYSGRYFIPNYLAVSQGMYYIEKWRKHQWEIQGGIRFDNKIIQTSRLKFNSDTINYNFDFSTLASSFNVAYTASPIWQMNLAVGISSRAPHVNELLSDGIHHGTGTYEKGDISLRPEKSVQVSAGIRYQHPSGKLGMDFLIYANRINDFIYQQPQPNNPVLTISGAFPLIQYQQTNASLRGFDWSAWFKPIENIEWISKYAFLNARNTSINDWLILMPANRLSNEITYRLKNTDKLANSYASIEVMHVSKQNNTPGDLNGKQDYKAAPEAYTLINLQISSTVQLINKPVTLSLGARNLMNTVYRDYLNSMRYFTDEMGRNISFRIKIQL